MLKLNDPVTQFECLYPHKVTNTGPEFLKNQYLYL